MIDMVCAIITVVEKNLPLILCGFSSIAVMRRLR